MQECYSSHICMGLCMSRWGANHSYVKKGKYGCTFGVRMQTFGLY